MGVIVTLVTATILVSCLSVAHARRVVRESSAVMSDLLIVAVQRLRAPHDALHASTRVLGAAEGLLDERVHQLCLRSAALAGLAAEHLASEEALASCQGAALALEMLVVARLVVGAAAVVGTVVGTVAGTVVGAVVGTVVGTV